MKISTILLATVTASILAFSTSAQSEEKTAKTTTKKSQSKEVAKPAPFDNYWAAKSWDTESSSFWSEKATPKTAKAAKK